MKLRLTFIWEGKFQLVDTPCVRVPINPYLNSHELALFDPHARISVPANIEWDATPVEELAKRFGILTLQKQGISSEGMPPVWRQLLCPVWRQL